MYKTPHILHRRLINTLGIVGSERTKINQNQKRRIKRMAKVAFSSNLTVEVIRLSMKTFHRSPAKEVYNLDLSAAAIEFTVAHHKGVDRRHEQ